MLENKIENNNNNINEYEELCKLYGKSLVDQEINLELESQRLGYERFIKTINQNKGEGQAYKSGTTREIIKEAILVFSKGLKDWFDKTNTGKAGKRHVCASLIKTLDVDTIAYTATSILLSQIKVQATLINACKEVANGIEEEVRYKRVLESMPEKEQKTFLNNLNKRVGLSYKKAFIRAKERYLESEEGLTIWNKWTASQKVQIGLKLIEIFCSTTGLAYLEKSSKKVDAKEIETSYLFVLDPVIVRYIQENDEYLAQMFYYSRPMVIPPKPWTTPFDGGYYIQLKKSIPLVRAPKSVVKELYSDVDMPNVYKAVNSIQSTAWRINYKVLEVANQISKWTVIPEGLGMPSEEPAEPPIRPAEADTNEEAQRTWRSSMLHYYQSENTRRGKRLLVNLVISMANRYAGFDSIYFPHNLDFRGRVYPLTVLSPQGNDFTKSLLEFSEGVELGEQGARWLAFHGANCYGLDKAPLEERLYWVYSNGELITRIAENPLDNLEWTETDSPWEFLAFCFEWSEYLKVGESFKSHLAVAFDGSCSGIQHFSAMLRDEVGGVAVNLVPDSKVHDIYKIVADKVLEQVKIDANEGTQDEILKDEEGQEYLKKGTASLAREWLKVGITRKVTKRCVMTLPYGAKQYGFADQILEDTIYPTLEKHMNAFSKPSQSARYMAKLIWEAVHKVVVKAMEAMNWLQEASALLAKTKDIYGNSVPTVWLTPAGFPVRQAYQSRKYKRIRSILSGEIKVVEAFTGKTSKKEEGDRIELRVGEKEVGKLDSRKQRQGIAPNFVHSMDASHLMLTVNACYDKGIDAFAMIHDSYGCHAGRADIMFETVRKVFVETYTNNDVLKDLHDHVQNMLPTNVVGDLPEIPSKGTLDLEVVKDSLYAFA